ncbi:expressed unknown protein [Seminavis robusta]|uniref:Uncharacterized protein n=1 Tax=Seminavis robusta TaxID=568900 RepID=A0A9N8F669_9STRA|nr:expressed unknown protein [Seminavis robusta]|eukprot:Sro4009_g352490.1 n/a (405) ;mRNA; f:1379-2593
MATAEEAPPLVVDAGESQAPGPAAAPTLVCKAKKCKKIEDLEPCWNEACQNHMHATCNKMLLDFNNIPPEQRPAEEDHIFFCGKRCYNKWWKQEQSKSDGTKKQKYVTWEEDGSQQILLNWITTVDNYSKYCGSTENNGTSKAQYHRIISELIVKQTNGQSQKTARDVANKIQKLEAQFRKASDWLNCTGAGLETGPGNISVYVKEKLCPFYYELECVMGDRPNAQPLATNEDDDINNVDDDDDDGSTSVAIDNIDEDDEDVDDDEIESEQPPAAAGAGPKTPTAKDSGKKKRLSSSGNKKPSKTRRGADDGILASLLDEDSDDDEKENSFKSLRKREVEAKEKEATALQLKTQKEVQLLDMQLQQQQQKHLIDLLKSRKELEDVGYTEAELDEMLGPLPANSI